MTVARGWLWRVDFLLAYSTLTLPVFSVIVTHVTDLNIAQVTKCHINNELIQDLRIYVLAHRHTFVIVIQGYCCLDKNVMFFVIIIIFNWMFILATDLNEDMTVTNASKATSYGRPEVCIFLFIHQCFNIISLD